MHQVLINGKWQESNSDGSFQAWNPATGVALDEHYPISRWEDLDAALDAAVAAREDLETTGNQAIVDFLESFAKQLESHSDSIRQLANLESALPLDTRLVGELARTTGQLRQAAAAARACSWQRPVIDTGAGIRSCLASLGPIAVFGPNNFPLAFGSISGGDFAAAIAAGNPVLAKANPMHPGTTRRLAEIAALAAADAGLPSGMIQMVYHMDYAVGEQLVADPRLGAVGFTGSRQGGLALKQVADRVGKPIYLELSSINPVVVLPGALAERTAEIADELTSSCVMGAGQFCTNPGIIFLMAGPAADQFIHETSLRMTAAPVGTLFSKAGQDSLADAIAKLRAAGAELVSGGQIGKGPGYGHENTVLRISAGDFLKHSKPLQTEAFGASTLLVTADSTEQLVQAIDRLEGNLTGCVYSRTDGSDDEQYDRVAPHLRRRVGRLINDQMPTGVAVSPAMNHGGPFPATGHPGFTAVGIPASITRFTMLQCYDHVRPHRLPAVLQDKNPGGVWRSIDGAWTQADVS